jgi:hypothetical protein
MAAAVSEKEKLAIHDYDNPIPSFIEPEIERLYGNLFSSFANFRTNGGIPQANTFIASRGGKIGTIFLYQRGKKTVRVLNEGMTLEPADVELFSDHIFSTFPDVGKIAFHAVTPAFRQLSFPHHRSMCSEDIIIDLPSTVEEYTTSLGASTRKTIKYRMNRLKRSFPTFHFECFEKDAVNERQVLDIIEFNRARMGEKNKVSVIDDDETRRILSLVKESGFVGVATIDGRVCAGTITYRIGKNHFSRINAHDPAYNEYRLGMLCCYLTICECIKHGAKRFHMFEGRYEYKYMLRGVLHLLDHVTIYRSYAHLLRDSGLLLRLTLKSHALKAVLSLQYKAGRRDGTMSDAAALCLRLLNGLKQAYKTAVDIAKNLRVALYAR